jgi:hypothetical protein
MNHPNFTKISLVLLFLGLSTLVNAQEDCQRCPKPTLTPVEQTKVSELQSGENDHPYGGTFQLICSKTLLAKENFTTDYLLPLVEEKRREDEEVTIELTPNTKLRILSKKQISAPGFQPIKNLYAFE